MIESIIYKEFIKTRWSLLLIAAAAWIMGAYVVLNVNYLIGVSGIDQLWQMLILSDVTYVETLQYLPLILGVTFGVVQFVPEMLQRRIKLMLHLPCNYFVSVGAMLGFGLVALVVVFLFEMLMVILPYDFFFPEECVRRVALTMLEWYMAGLQAYVFTAWICLEPSWRMRLLNALFAGCILKMYFMLDVPEAYNAFLPILGLYLILSVSFSFLSVERFKQGK